MLGSFPVDSFFFLNRYNIQVEKIVVYGSCVNCIFSEVLFGLHLWLWEQISLLTHSHAGVSFCNPKVFCFFLIPMDAIANQGIHRIGWMVLLVCKEQKDACERWRWTVLSCSVIVNTKFCKLVQILESDLAYCSFHGYCEYHDLWKWLIIIQIWHSDRCHPSLGILIHPWTWQQNGKNSDQSGISYLWRKIGSLRGLCWFSHSGPDIYETPLPFLSREGR